jgi:GNAT superfamily N-acetyltransferase
MSSYSFTIQRVNNPTEEQIDISADLFYDLMKENQGAISLSGGDKSLMKLQALAILRAGALAGEYYTATNPDGELVAYTLWMPPGQELFSSEEQRKLGFTEFMTRLPEEGKEYFRTAYLAHFPGFVNGILGPAGKRDSWWLHMAMVRSDYQKKGITRALINAVRDKASKSGDTLACSTTNNDNVPVYTALGFTRRGEKIMPSPWGDWPVHLFSLNTSETSP